MNEIQAESEGLLEAIRFNVSHWELVHVLERLSEPATYSKRANDFISSYLRLQEEEGRKLLLAAEAELKTYREKLKTTLLNGFVANALIRHAEETKTDLLALGSTGKGPVEGVLIGSVGRKATIGSRCSVLIAKGRVKNEGAFKAVFATDGSDYNARCLERLLAFKPTGIAEVIVTSVVPRGDGQVMEWQRFELDEPLRHIVGRLPRPELVVARASRSAEWGKRSNGS